MILLINGLTDTLVDKDLIRVRVDLRVIYFTLNLISGLDCGEFDLGLRSRHRSVDMTWCTYIYN